MYLHQSLNLNKLFIVILLFQGPLQCLASFSNYNEAILTKSAESYIQEINMGNLDEGDTYGLGFWSMSIPLLNHESNKDFDNPYDSLKIEYGQMLLLVRDIEANSNILLVYKLLDYENLKVLHQIRLMNNDQDEILQYEFKSLEYEGIWIFHLILIQPQLKMIIIEINGQPKKQTQILTKIQQNLQIILGGRGYINDLNLNTFKGLLSQMIFLPNLFYSDSIFQVIINDCQIPPKYTDEQIVNIVPGFKIFDGVQAQQHFIEHYGNKYCLTGWVKYLINDINEQKYILLRMTGFLNYNQQKQLGDELFKLEVFFSKRNPEQTYMIIFTDAYSMPVQQSFQEQFHQTFKESQNTNYDIYQSKRIFQDLNNFQYYEGLQKWHYIQYEYGRSNFQEKLLFQGQFYNELGLIKERMGNDIFGGSFTNSRYNIFFGSDNYNNQFLQAEIVDFQIRYNYNDDKELDLKCHYSCLTCKGPLQNDCLSCDENSHRYYQSEKYECNCNEGYFEFELGFCTNQFISFVQLNEMSINNNRICPLGYFRLPIDGDQYECKQCPQSITQQNILCAECFWYYKTWYLKPTCKYDYIKILYRLNDEAYQLVKRDPIYYDVYSIGLDYELDLHPELEDYCEDQKEMYQSCFDFKFYHLGSYRFLKCKSNYLIDPDSHQCLKFYQNCPIYDSFGYCYGCYPGQYLIFGGCLKCPNECLTCENDGYDQPLCNSCTESYGLIDNQCQQCGQFCQSCQTYYDTFLGYQYLKCYRCIDDSQYFLSFDAQNCLINQITNCTYAFQVIKNDFTKNTLDFHFQPQFDKSLILTLCAKCNKYYVFTFQTNECIKDNITEDCEIGIGQLNPIDQSLDQVICLSSSLYQNDIVQFTQDCINLNCQVCLETDILHFFTCLKCQQGYYIEKPSGQCLQCPKELKCKTCSFSNSLYKDSWKNQIRAFYRKYIEILNTHLYNVFGESQNTNDYVILCETCIDGYQLHNQQCIPYCQETCQLCLIQNNQFICVQCHSEQKGKKLTLINNQCIECPDNCALCRIRTDTEISLINPLFQNQKYQKYTHQCLKSFDDQKYYYDEDLGLFIECLQQENGNGCFKQLIIEINLYSDQQQYYSDLNSLEDEKSRIKFKKENIILERLVGYGNGLTEFSDEQFYTLANSKIIKSLIIKIKNKGQNFSLYFDGKIKQTFSENIFSLINVEIEFNFKPSAVLIVHKNFEIINFSKITFSGFIIQAASLQLQQRFYFQSLFPQTVILDQITFQIFNELINSVAFQFHLLNLKFLQFTNLIINKAFIDQAECFMKVEYTLFPKSLIFKNIKIKDCVIDNLIIFDLGLNEGDYIEFDNITLNSNFSNSEFIRASQFNESGELKMTNFNLTSNIYHSENFFNLKGIGKLNINQFDMRSSILTKSTIILLNRQSHLENIYFTDNQFLNQSFGIINSDYNDQIIVQTFSNLFFLNNQYDSLIKFIYLKKYSSKTQNVTIKYLNQINNNFRSNQLNYNRKQVDFSLITLQYDVVEIFNFYIDRGYGLNDLSIYDCKKIKIQSGIIEQNKFRFLGLHKYLSCQLKYVKALYYSTTINIISSQLTEIQNVTFSKLISSNFPIISISSADLIILNQNEEVYLKDLIFNQNLVIKTELLFQTSLISIQSSQYGRIEAENINLLGNILHVYIQNDYIKTAGLLIFNCPFCQIYLINQQIQNNIITNCSSNIIYIEAQTLEIRNSLFNKNNIFNYQILQPHILWGFTSRISQQIIESVFQTKSQSGIGQINAQQIKIINNNFFKSFGSLGGCFSIFPQAISNISIINNKFEEIQTQFYKEIEQGAGIYIDGSSSASLLIEIINNTAKNIFCRQLGGFLYLKSNISSAILNIQNLYLQDIYAQQGSAFYIQYSKFVSDQQVLNLKNLQVINSYDGYISFLNKFSEIPKSQELNSLTNSRSLIYLEYGSLIQVQDIKINNLMLESFIILISINHAYLSDVYIKNSFINNNLITITPFSTQSLQLILNNLQFTNITTRFYFNNLTCKIQNIKIDNIIYQCLNYIQSAPLILSNEDQYQDDNQNAFCIYDQFKQYVVTQNSGLILLHDLKSQDQISIVQLFLIHIDCSICDYGLISFNYQSNELIAQQQQITSLYVQNSKCGNLGCLNLYKPNKNSNRILNQQDIFSLNYEFIIKNFICQYNFGYQGTCLRINYISILVQNSNFQYNQAAFEGGSIYIKGNQNFILENTIIQFNNASYGGGLYLQDQIGMNYEKSKTKILRNHARIYSDNVASSPQKLKIQIKQNSFLLKTKTIIGNSTMKIQELNIDPYKSINGKQLQFLQLPTGQKINEYQIFDWKNKIYLNPFLTFKIFALGEDINNINNLENSYCTIQSRRINISEKEDENQQKFTNNYTSIRKIYYNTSTQNYNLDEMIIYFDNQSPEEIVLQLQIMCNSIKVPIYSNQYPFEIIDYHSNYMLRVNIKTYDCQFGEIKNRTTQSCQKCDSNQDMFSLTLNSEKCEVKDDFSTLSVENNQLILRAGYWRPYFDTIKISFCLNLDSNCLGGIYEGDNSCYIGHIGSLCEQCDLYNIRGNGQYSVIKKFICGPCIEKDRNIILILGIIIFTLIFLLISVSGNIKTIENCTKYQPFKILKSSIYLNKNQSGMLIKILTNYFQIIVAITTFQLQLSEGLNSSLEIVGNPLQTTSYSLDCFLAALSDFEIQYIRMIWQMALPVIYVTIFIGFYFLTYKIRNIKFNPSVITTTFIYIYCYFQPNLINGFIELVSYRNISGFKWIQANVSQRYDSAYHTKWIFQFCLPFILLFAIVIPSFFFFGLYSNKEKLEKKNIRLLWGYLYNEYKKEAYFWELIKIVEKELIILSLLYYQDSVVAKGVLVLFITYLYQELNEYYKPYILNKLNKLDYYSTNICMITIGLAIGIYISQQTKIIELQIIFLFIIALLNLVFLNQIITKIIMEYIKEYEIYFDKIKDFIKLKFPFYYQNHLWLRRYLKNRVEERKNVQKLFLKLKLFGIPLAKNQIQIRQKYLSQSIDKKNFQFIDYIQIQKPETLDLYNKTSQQRMINLQSFPDV
ncbi:unnamed protein product [Paramecium sonneborni]|uniref:Transmembrane protein n=1 Tax=Paramecium sonneborni TaxID=65129 RepID=A0A8S1RAA1_9CILI|nr:unnamed protein product [Paramecium sonneborni]